MRAVGVTSTVITGAVVVLALVLGVRSVPDIKRYLEMRRM